ncbi:anti-sigma factor [Micromonospora sp. NPDC049900]|uniref:anti-sigma factor n=1 Tax=Micromonospora sp. NPDC049900 TaxID=3364275 RepID=UPI0037BC2257
MPASAAVRSTGRRAHAGTAVTTTRGSPSAPLTGAAPGARSAGLFRHSARARRRRPTAPTSTVVHTAGASGRTCATDPAPPAQTVVASARLDAYGSTPARARGDARVLDSGELHPHVANLPAVPGYYEVWLINPNTMEMFSIGVLGTGNEVLLPLPPNVDLGKYSVVDVSAERFDNDTAHSGDSLLRGSLTG